MNLSQVLAGRSLWYLWWTKWRWCKFIAQSLGFPLSVSLRCRSIFIYVSSGWLTKGAGTEATVPQRRSLTPSQQYQQLQSLDVCNHSQFLPRAGLKPATLFYGCVTRLTSYVRCHRFLWNVIITGVSNTWFYLLALRNFNPLSPRLEWSWCYLFLPRLSDTGTAYWPDGLFSLEVVIGRRPSFSSVSVHTHTHAQSHTRNHRGNRIWHYETNYLCTVKPQFLPSSWLCDFQIFEDK